MTLQAPDSTPRPLSILIVGPTSDLCDGVRGMLAGQPGLQVATMVSDRSGALATPAALRPDVLIAVLGPAWDEAMQSLSAMPQRPPTIVVGPSNDSQLLRRAMQAGVRDYLAAPLSPREINEAVQRIAREQAPVQPQEPAQQGQMIAVINVKGGSGASFIAANLAHIAAVRSKAEIGLLDLDLQFGALPLAFDLEKRSTLIEALSTASQLDPTALRGYMARHESGVSVLSAMSEQLVLPWEVSREALVRLLQVMRQTFPVVFVDLPRQIDPLTSAVIEQADKVMMVMQQSLAHARDAKRMQRVVTATLGLPRDKLLLVVNRHSDKQSVRGRDVQEAVNPSSMAVLPNDFITVTEALNIGVPVYDYDRDAIITRALEDLAGRLGLPVADGATRKRGLREVLSQALRT